MSLLIGELQVEIFISFWRSYVCIFTRQAIIFDFSARTDLRSELESLFYEIHLLEKTDQSRSQDLTKLKDILLHCKDEVRFSHFYPYLTPPSHLFTPVFTLIYPRLHSSFTSNSSLFTLIFTPMYSNVHPYLLPSSPLFTPKFIFFNPDFTQIFSSKVKFSNIGCPLSIVCQKKIIAQSIWFGRPCRI